MTVILEKSIFIHIPKTGGTWVTEALQNARLAKSNLCFANNRILGVKHFNISRLKSAFPDKNYNKVFFIFVRNPVTWYQSIWTNPFTRRRSGEKKYIVNWKNNRRPRMQQEIGISGKPELRYFNTWADRIVNQYPSWLTRYYKHYLGENYEKISLIGKTENLAEDLIDILNKIGEEFDFDRIKRTKPINRANKNLDRSWDRRILRKIIDNESEFMEKFGYSTSLKDYLELCN